jgi:hypothetical protein
MSEPQTQSPGPGEATEDPEGLRCDFCGRTVIRVRRVALDDGYDRLQVRHVERYACPDCSARKERQRVGPGKG